MSGFVDPSYLYGVHITPTGGAVAFRWHEPTDRYETIDLATVAGNHLDLPLFDLDDSHFGLSVAVDDQDVVLVVGNHHEGISSPTTTHLLACTDVQAFTDVSSWHPASTSHYDQLDEAVGTGGYTYHHFDRLADGTLLHFLSQSERFVAGGGDTRGRDYLAFKRSSGSWSPLVGDGHFATTERDAIWDVEANRVYICGVHVHRTPSGGEQVYVHGIWRTRDADPSSQQAPFLLYADAPDLATWRYMTSPVGPPPTPDGVQPMPITWQNRMTAQITSAPATSSAVRMGVYVDSVTQHPAVI
jgi:hypothetical protein